MVRTTMVVGAGGFIGRHLIDALSTRPDRLIAIGPRLSDVEGNIEVVGRRVSTAKDFLPLVSQCDFVIYLASSSTPASTAGAPHAEITENLLPLLALLEALQEHPKVRLLYMSSGGSLYTDTETLPSNESAVIAPRSYHGATKAACEHFISAWASQYGGSAAVLRPSNVYGPGQERRAGFAVIPTAFEKISRGETIAVWGGSQAVRDYLFIDDLVELCLKVLDSFPNRPFSVFNASSGVGTSLADLFQLMEAVSGRPLMQQHKDHRNVDAKHVVISASLAQQTFGWTPRIPLPEGLERTWNWMKAERR